MLLVRHISFYFVGSILVLFLGFVVTVIFAAIAINPKTAAATDYASSTFLATPPPLLEAPLTLKIVTYNIADGYLFTTNRRERIQAIAALLTELDPDIVGLQECFIASDRELLLESLKDSRLRYHADYPAATVGNGLFTLSAYPIVEQYFHRFRANNPWYKLYQGDWWAGKGIGLARIALPSGAQIDFYNTHAQAGRRDENNLRVRDLQMRELSAFLNESRSRTAPAFIVGDFNTRLGRSDLQYAMDNSSLRPVVTIDTGIDFIFTAENDLYDIEAVETQAIEGCAQGSASAIFLSRAPSPRELWKMWFGKSEETPLSDHTGYMSTIVIHTRTATSA